MICGRLSAWDKARARGVAWWEEFADHMTSDSWGSEEGGLRGKMGVE